MIAKTALIKRESSMENYNEKFIRPEKIEITARGVKKSYRFLHISDAHVAVAYENDSDADKALAEKQSTRWSLGELTSTESFEEMLKYVRHIRPDALLIAGTVWTISETPMRN